MFKKYYTAIYPPVQFTTIGLLANQSFPEVVCALNDFDGKILKTQHRTSFSLECGEPELQKYIFTIC